MPSCKAAAFYRIGVFALEPSEYAPALGGSVGHVAPDGCLEWYAEGLRLGKPPYPVSVLVTYQRTKGQHEAGPPLPTREDERDAMGLAERLVLPSVLETGRPVHPRLLAIISYDCQRQSPLPYHCAARRAWLQAGSDLGGPPPEFGINYEALRLDEGLRRAARYYSLGLADAEEQHLSDACDNYVKALESLFGSWRRAGAFIRRECSRIGADLDEVRWLMNKARGKYAVAHVLDHVEPKGERKFKEDVPPHEEERARSACAKTLGAYWTAMQASAVDRQRGGVGHSWPLGPPPPVPTAWEAVELAGGSLVATSLIPQLTTYRPISEAAERHGLSRSWVQTLCRTGRVKAVRVGSQYLVDVSSLEAWLLSHSPKRQAQGAQSMWYISLSTASKAYGLRVSHLRRLIAEGTLRGYTLGDETELVDTVAIAEYVAAKERRRQRKGRPLTRGAGRPLRW